MLSLALYWFSMFILFAMAFYYYFDDTLHFVNFWFFAPNSNNNNMVFTSILLWNWDWYCVRRLLHAISLSTPISSTHILTSIDHLLILCKLCVGFSNTRCYVTNNAKLGAAISNKHCFVELCCQYPTHFPIFALS